MILLAIVLKDTNNIENLKSIVKNLHSELNLRITIIDNDGVVIAESDKDLSSIGNHANRLEIIQARNVGMGKDTRRSQTINQDLYILQKIELKIQSILLEWQIIQTKLLIILFN